MPTKRCLECRIHVSDEDIAFLEGKQDDPTIVIDSMRDVLRVFVNGKATGKHLEPLSYCTLL